MYETFEHTADLGLRMQAASIDELFVDAARGLFSILVVNLDTVRPVQEKSITLEGDEELDFLLFDWLNELLYVFESDRLLFSEFSVEVVEGRLTATCRGEPVDPTRHQLDHEIKAITYHALKMERRNGGWLAEVIVDI